MLLSPMSIIISSIVGGAVVFGLYHLLHMLAIKKKGSIQSTSFVLKMPLFISCINLLLVLCLAVPVCFVYLANEGFSFFIHSIIYPEAYHFGYHWAWLTLYPLLSMPISIGSIAISFVNYKKLLIPRKNLGLVVLMYIICIISLLIYSYTMSIIRSRHEYYLFPY